MSMAEGELKTRILDAMKDAMRAQSKERLGTIRLIQAAIKQKEVDERVPMTDSEILDLLGKLIRQRKESIKQFELGGRQDLVEKESREIDIIQEFLPKPLTRAEIDTLIDQAVLESGASSIRDMSKVMALLKPKLQGRADLGEVGGFIKSRLSS